MDVGFCNRYITIGIFTVQHAIYLKILFDARIEEKPKHT